MYPGVAAGMATTVPPAIFTDDVTNTQAMGKYKGKTVEYKRPGRGEGFADVPGLKLFGLVDPEDILQGTVGDCWMLSAISALAEFEVEVQDIFAERKLSPEGKYTLRMFDLPTQKFKYIVIDDRVAFKNGELMGAKLTADNEIWPLLLEKAFAVHAGGWDKIEGGNSALALAVLTGSTNTFRVCNTNFEKGGVPEFEKYEYDLEKFEENNSKCPASKTTKAGVFSNGQKKLGKEQFFDLLCDWDAKNYVVCAGTGSEKDGSDGIVYALISAKKQVCGKFDMLLFRNPHDKTEYSGEWRDGGEQWARNPDVKQALGHQENPNDGLFWMSKEEAFKYYQDFFVCAKSMRGNRRVVNSNSKLRPAPSGGCFGGSRPAPPQSTPIRASANQPSATPVPAVAPPQATNQMAEPPATTPTAPATTAPAAPAPPAAPAAAPKAAKPTMSLNPPHPYFVQPGMMGGMPMGGMPMGGMPMGGMPMGFPGMPMPNQFPGTMAGPSPMMGGMSGPMGGMPGGGMPGFSSPYF